MPDIVIVGGGIVGLCTAYYLAANPAALPSNTHVTLLENVSVACGASSRAAGFIGGGPAWHKEANQDLARLSWECYEQLARQLDGPNTYGYRHCSVTGLRVGAGQDAMSSYRQLPTGTLPLAQKGEARQPWYRGDHVNLDTSGLAAQLDPAQFCSTLHAEVTRLGVRTIIAQPLRRRGKVIETTEGDVAYDKLLIAAGPWSADLCTLLNIPRVPVGSLPGHHIVLKPGTLPAGYDSVPAEAVMAGVGGSGSSDDLAATVTAGGQSNDLSAAERQQGWTQTIEFFPRPDGTVYAAGENNVPNLIGDATIDGRENRLPLTGRYVHRLVDQDLVQRMLRSSAAVSPALDVNNGAELVKADLCYRPVTADTMPLIGEWQRDVFVCAGHGPWGITLAPGSGVVMAELIATDLTRDDVKLSADISGLSPHRFCAAKL